MVFTLSILIQTRLIAPGSVSVFVNSLPVSALIAKLK